MHVPVATKVTAVSETVQMPKVAEEKTTASDDDALALTEKEPLPNLRSAREVKVIVWEA